eukprot:COSAG06_NODE_28063_length_581_cov_1.114108_1_plen_162_part_01
MTKYIRYKRELSRGVRTRTEEQQDAAASVPGGGHGAGAGRGLRTKDLSVEVAAVAGGASSVRFPAASQDQFAGARVLGCPDQQNNGLYRLMQAGATPEYTRYVPRDTALPRGYEPTTRILRIDEDRSSTRIQISKPDLRLGISTTCAILHFQTGSGIPQGEH